VNDAKMNMKSGLFKNQNGHAEIKGGGKGSHVKLRKGNKTVIILQHKELKKGFRKGSKKITWRKIVWYHFKIHKEKGGFWAECIELPGCVTQANSKEELHVNMHEALNCFLEESEDSEYIAPLPKSSIKPSRTVVEISVHPSVALAFSIRRQRIKQGLTQREVADQLGMKGIYSYQRLERKCNPTLDLIYKLVLVFPAISLDKILR
jgi:predicted RNase H-like HicB family nuclease/DNA-binding XRE family transcriptional regulator